MADEQPTTTNVALPTNPAAALDLNPTGFVDDLYNAVSLACTC